MIIFSNYLPKDFFKKYDITSGGYYNCPISYDIETTSYYDNKGEKQVITYIHGFLFDNTYVYFRNWNDFNDFINYLKCIIHPFKIIIYVHNLSYEFQFFRKQIPITSIFARKERRPIKCKSSHIEFRCSYFLTQLSLKNLAINNGYSLKEKYDYYKFRDYTTYLSKDEILYNVVDNKIVVQHIRKLLNNYDIDKIPLTSTAFTRQHALNYLKNDNITNYNAYRDMIKKSFPTAEIFKILMFCFAGGYTHANARLANITLENVYSYDFTSHYPAVMFRHKYPYKFVPVETTFNSDDYATIGYYVLTNITAKNSITTISKNKCYNIKNAKYDNGRIIQAEYVEMYLTDVDIKCIDLFYNYNIECKCKYASRYKYLPQGLIKSMLYDYKLKTELKGVTGQEDNYLASKGRLNSFYGMCVTNPLNDDIDYVNNEWITKPILNLADTLEEQKNKYNTFLLYQWGVYITAWARYDLLQNVAKIVNEKNQNNTVYCDTDSIKFIGEHHNIFSEFNEQIRKENILAANYFKVSIDDYAPKSKTGERYEIGLFDNETKKYNYRYFKTLGAKRYMYLQRYHYHFTVSGIAKNAICKYLKKLSRETGEDIFDLFTHDLEIPAEYTQKMTMTYIDNANNAQEKSTVHAEKAPFKITMSTDYLQLLFRISNKSSSISNIDILNDIDEFKFEKEV